MPTWFDQTNTPPVQSSTTPPKKSKRLLLLIGAVLVIGVCALLGVMFATSRSASCFSASNFGELLTLIDTVSSDTIGEDDVTSQTLLYSHSVYFQQRTVDFDTERSEDPTKFLQSIGTYYKAQHTSAPISVQISTSYTTTDSAELAQQRINLVKDILLQAGVADSVITTPQPSPLQASDDSTEDDDILDDTPVVFVSITPLSNCEIKD